MEIRPEQELVVKKEGFWLRVLMRGMMGVSNVPFGDLSVSVEDSEARLDAFLFSNSIVACFVVSELQRVVKPNKTKTSVRG